MKFNRKITVDMDSIASEEGVRVVDLIDWLQSNCHPLATVIWGDDWTKVRRAFREVTPPVLGNQPIVVLSGKFEEQEDE